MKQWPICTKDDPWTGLPLEACHPTVDVLKVGPIEGKRWLLWSFVQCKHCRARLIFPTMPR